jgi:arylsulfatase
MARVHNAPIGRRQFFGVAAGALAHTAARGRAPHSIVSPPRPHIILLMTDQHRGDCLGCAGNRAVQTPQIDAIARDGVLFRRAYSSVPSCTPARAGLLTGCAPWRHGMLGYGDVAVRYPHEMPRLLHDAGYHAFGIGKMHFHPQRNLHGFETALLDESGRVESPGFESDYRQWFRERAPKLDPDATGIGWNEHRAGTYVLAEDLHPTSWTGNQAVACIDRYDEPAPLFLKVSFARPHSPYDPPRRCLDRFAGVSIPPPVNGAWDAPFAAFPDTPDAPFGNFGVEHAVDSRRHYYASIAFIDDQVGRVVAALKRKGMYDNALIVFVADHGDMLGDHFHWRKTYPYEGSSRIPFVVKWPTAMRSAVPRGSTLDRLVELRDVLPTMLDAAGIAAPGEMDGRSVLGPIRDRNAAWRNQLDLEHATCYRAENDWAALTDARYKYVFNFHTGAEQLFDLREDPGETRDLAGDAAHRALAGGWHARLASHLAERGESWVKAGRIQTRPAGIIYGANYPRGQAGSVPQFSSSSVPQF